MVCFSLEGEGIQMTGTEQMVNTPLTTLGIVTQATMMTTVLKVIHLHATLVPPHVEVGWRAQL